MSDKDFDKKIKNTVNKHPSEFDVDSFWNSIEGEVKDINAKKKKKRIIPFYFLGLVLFGLVSILSGIYFTDNSSIDKDSEIQASEKDENQSIVSFDEKIIEEETTNLSNDLPDSSLSVSEAYGHEEQFFTSADFGYVQPTLNLNDSSVEKNRNPNFDFSKKKKIEIPEIIETKKMILTESPTPFLQAKNLESIALVQYRYKRKKTLEFNFGIQGGANFAPRNLESINADSEPYATLRNETETSKIGFQLGLKSGIKHKSGFTFSTGLNYTQITERFKYQGSTFQEVFVENGIIRYEININMDTIPIFGDFEFTQEIVHNKDFRNSYRLFEVPILIGYEKDFDDWSFGIQTGIFANISTQTSGLIFSPNNELVTLETVQATYFKSNIGLSYYFGGEGKYSINENFALTFSPHLRVFPKSFTNNQHEIIQKYSFGGLNLGVDFKF